MKNKKLVNAMCIAMGITMLGSMSAEAATVTGDKTYTTSTATDLYRPIANTTQVITITPGTFTDTYNKTYNTTSGTNNYYVAQFNNAQFTINGGDDVTLKITANNSANKQTYGTISALQCYANTSYTMGPTMNVNFNSGKTTLEAITDFNYAAALWVEDKAVANFAGDAVLKATSPFSARGVYASTHADSTDVINFNGTNNTIEAIANGNNDANWTENFAYGIDAGSNSTINFNGADSVTSIKSSAVGGSVFGYAHGVRNSGAINVVDAANFKVDAAGGYQGTIGIYNGIYTGGHININSEKTIVTAKGQMNYGGTANNFGIVNQNGDDSSASTMNVTGGDFSVSVTGAGGINTYGVQQTSGGVFKVDVTGDIDIVSDNSGSIYGVDADAFIQAGNGDSTLRTSGGKVKLEAISANNPAASNKVAIGLEQTSGTGKVNIIGNEVSIAAKENITGWWGSAYGIRSRGGSGDISVNGVSKVDIKAESSGGDDYGILAASTGTGTISLDADTVSVLADNTGDFSSMGVKVETNRTVKTNGTNLNIDAKVDESGGQYNTNQGWSYGVNAAGGTFSTYSKGGNNTITAINLNLGYTAGIKATDGGKVELLGNKDIITARAENMATATGIDAAGGSTITADVWDDTFTLKADSQKGVSAGAKIDASTLKVTGTNAYDFTSTATSTESNLAQGLFVTGATGEVKVEGARLVDFTAEAQGTDDSKAYGLNVEDGANVTLNPLATAAVNFTATNTGKGTARGIKATNGGTIDLGTSDALTINASNVARSTTGTGRDAYGMDIWSTTLKGTANTVAINATSPTDVAIGTKTFGTGSIDLKGNDSLEINATGDSAYSIWSSTSATNDFQAANLKVKAESTGNVALAVRNDIGTVNVTSPNGEITANTTASGKEAIGVYSMAVSPANPAITNIEGINKITATSADPDMNYAFYASTNTGVENATINYNAANAAGANIVEGNIFANDNGIVNANFNGATSTFTGWAQDSKNAGNPGQVNIGLKDKATWVYEVNQAGDNNSVTALNSDDGIVDMTNVTGYQTLEVGTLTGANGLFKIDTDLASNTDGDKIFVTDSNSATQQYMQVTDKSLHTGTPAEGKLLVAKDYSSTMSFLPKDLFSGGLWVNTPELVGLKDDPSNPGLTNWYLLTIKKSLTEDVNVMKNAYEAGFRSLMIDEDDTLLKRLGDLRNGTRDGAGVWARMYRSKFGGDNYDKNSSTVQVGIDKEVKGKNGSWIYGLAGGHTTGDMSYKLGQGNNNVTTGALYATNYKNDGQYLDLVLRRSKLNADLKTFGTAPDSGNYSTWGTTVSAEYGKRFKQKAAGTFVEPQVQLSWGHMNGVSYLSDTGINVGMDAMNSLVGRLGFVAGRQLKDSNYYFKANAFHEFSGNGGWNVLAANGETALGDSHFGGTWYELGVGANVQLSRNTDFHFDLEKGFGGDVKKKYQVTAGMRWAF